MASFLKQKELVCNPWTDLCTWCRQWCIQFVLTYRTLSDCCQSCHGLSAFQVIYSPMQTLYVEQPACHRGSALHLNIGPSYSNQGHAITWNQFRHLFQLRSAVHFSNYTSWFYSWFCSASLACSNSQIQSSSSKAWVDDFWVRLAPDV